MIKPRRARVAPGGIVYHALNRAVARLPLFQTEGDYEAFERVLMEALDKHPIRVLGYCMMPNHWHFILWPKAAGELTAFLRWLTHTHTMRWHSHYHMSGSGHLYQGRFRAFPIQGDDHYFTALRYAERKRAVGDSGQAGRGLALGKPLATAIVYDSLMQLQKKK